MKRQVIQIDAAKCDGCGLCVRACHEGALGLIDGKAVLLRDDFCDGMGDCLPACPQDAISFVEREALPYDEEAVKRHLEARKAEAAKASASTAAPSCASCPSTAGGVASAAAPEVSESRGASQLRQWPVQIKLLPVTAPAFQGARLLIAADCAAFAHGNFHEEFIKGRVVLVGCPKLDAVDYTEKLAQIMTLNDVTEVLVTRMQVPCCGGLERAARNAVALSQKDIPLQVVTIASDGSIVSVQ